MKRSNFTSDLKFWIGMTTDEIRTDSQELDVINPAKKNTALETARCIDAIYYLKNSMFISPLSFMQSLLTYYITGSKTSVVLNSDARPSGSYTTVTNWITEYSKEALQCPDEMGVITFFDNNQVLQRKLRVVTDFKSENSVITNIIHVMPNSNSLLQFEERFSPRHWFKCDQTSKNKAIGDILIIFQQEDVAFCKFRNQFIEEQLEVVRDGFTVEDGNIDWNCNPHDRYNFVTSGHPDDKIKVVMGHPCFENPCSFKSVEKVFDHIENLTKSNRKWTILGCDAPPYTIGNKVIGNHMVCIDCEIEFEEEEAFLEHIKDRDHCLSTPIENCRKYNNIFILPDDMISPVSCFYGMIHYQFGVMKLVKGRYICNNPLKWYLCKSSDGHVSSINENGMRFTKNSLSTKMQDEASTIPKHYSLIGIFTSVSKTTVVVHTKTTEKNEEEVHNEVNKFQFGAIVGGGLSVVVVIALMLVLVVCKLRSCGIFKAPKMEQHDVFSSNATNDDSNIPADINSVITSNQTYGIENSRESSSNTYAAVNKKPCSSSKANDEIYTESSYGEYDRLNEVQKRKILTIENLYDSNEGTRNENDPTYNSSDFCEVKTNNHDSDMDTYSIMSTKSGGYTLNLT